MTERQVVAAVQERVELQLALAITANPVTLQPFERQCVQIQAIASKGWRQSADVRAVEEPVPEAQAGLFATLRITRGLRAVKFFAVPGHTAADNGIEQTHIVMNRLRDTLADLSATFRDVIKKEGHDFGTTMEQWAGMAAMRGCQFREPAAVATVVPCHRLDPEGAVTKVEVLG